MSKSTKESKQDHFYQIEFKDGRVVRREGVSYEYARAVYKAMFYEMELLQVESVEMGKMR